MIIEELKPEHYPHPAVNYRFLPESEWHKLEAIFDEYGSQPPAKGLGKIAIAEDNGQIVGFVVLQLVLHAEPLWIREDHRQTDTVSWRRLLNMVGECAAQIGKEYYVFIPDERAAHIAKVAGLSPLSWRIWRKRFS